MENDLTTAENDVEILQENHYYPFGMELIGPWYAQLGEENNYQYNGKELEEDLGLYDYGARYYDPAIARWGQVDPLAEEDYMVSPYVYVRNNPILLLDPTGMIWVNPYEGVEGKEKEADRVNQTLKNLRDNDPELYDYIENLSITIDGVKVQIKVNVLVSNERSGKDGQVGDTKFVSSPKEGDYEGESIPVPIFNSSYGQGVTGNGIGFNITLFSPYSGTDDATLANEAGDVMFALEEPEKRAEERSASTISGDNYERGWANDYSDSVENAYKLRSKGSKKVADVKNMYPLQIRKNTIYSNDGKVILGRH